MRTIKTIRAHEVKVGDEITHFMSPCSWEVGKIITTPKGKLLFLRAYDYSNSPILGRGVDPNQRVHIMVDKEPELVEDFVI